VKKAKKKSGVELTEEFLTSLERQKEQHDAVIARKARFLRQLREKRQVHVSNCHDMVFLHYV